MTLDLERKKKKRLSGKMCATVGVLAAFLSSSHPARGSELDAGLLQSSRASDATTNGASRQIFLAQTWELRNTAVPAKTVDDSGIKLNEDPLATPSTQTVLTGVLTKQELQGRVNVNNDGKSLTLYLVNRGKRALIFSGDEAVVLNGQVQEKAKSQNETFPPPKKTQIRKDVIDVAVSIASDGAVPSIYDVKTQYQADGTPYYGKDQERRKLAERRFGQRTLFPGESTSGKVYLPDACNLPAQLSIPVIVHPSGESLGNLVLQINPEQ